MAKYLSTENYENVVKSIDYMTQMSTERLTMAEKIINEGPIEHSRKAFTQALHDRTCETMYLNAISTIKGIINAATDDDEEKEEKPILTEEEKNYLNAVIKPFIGRVTNFKKVTLEVTEYIVIDFEDDPDIYFPSFDKGTMYQGMESNREYTLEELGLGETK